MSRHRLLTYNIAHARGLTLHQGLRTETKLRAQLRKIAQLIMKLDADIVALQEIDENSRWSGSFDHLAYLREHTGLEHAVFGLTTRNAGRYHLNYGNAVLSRLPIAHVENMPFGRGKFGEKGFLFVELESALGRLPLINLHLHHSSRPQRLRQITRLMHFIDEKRAHRAHLWHTLPLVCGDFNNPSHVPDATATLLGYFEQDYDYTLLPKAGRTFPSPWPQRAIDYIFLPQVCREPQAQVVRSLLSDHRPVLAEFTL